MAWIGWDGGWRRHQFSPHLTKVMGAEMLRGLVVGQGEINRLEEGGGRTKMCYTSIMMEGEFLLFLFLLLLLLLVRMILSSFFFFTSLMVVTSSSSSSPLPPPPL